MSIWLYIASIAVAYGLCYVVGVSDEGKRWRG